MTSNHYWLDGIVAIGLPVPSMIIARRGIAHVPPWPWRSRFARRVEWAAEQNATGHMPGES